MEGSLVDGSLFGSELPKGMCFPSYGRKPAALVQAIKEKAPTGMEVILRSQSRPNPYWCYHVSLMLMSYRRAKSLLLSLYTSVLMPFTSSTTSLPVSLSM